MTLPTAPSAPLADLRVLAGPLASPATSPAAATTGSSPPAPVPVPEMRPGLSAEQVRLRLACATRDEELSRRVLAFYLVEMDDRRLYQATGHGSTVHYAETRLSLDRRRVAELLRVGRRLLELPASDRAFCEGRLGWAKLLILSRMAVPEHEAAWLERALALDTRALYLLAARSREGGPPRAPGDEKGLPEIRFPLSGSFGALELAEVETAQRRLSDEQGREVDFGLLVKTLVKEFLAAERAPGPPEDPGSAPPRRDASIYRVQLIEGAGGGDPDGPLWVETGEGPLAYGVRLVSDEFPRCTGSP